MRHHIPETQVIFAFDRAATPAMEIDPGDEVVFSTLDCGDAVLK